MTDETKGRGSDAPEYRSTDLLICPYCKHEFSLLPSAETVVTCSRCKASSDKSDFTPLTSKRTVWVSQSMLPEYYDDVVSKQIRDDLHSIVELYRELFIRSVDMGVLKSIGFLAYGFRFGVKLAYSLDISLEEVALLLKQQMDVTPVFNLLDNARVHVGPATGRPLRPERVILMIDATLLSLCPDGYLHFLRDALTLRYKEYAVSPTYARSHTDQWNKFRRSKRATEVYCKRIWRNLVGREPEPPPEGWELDVAHHQGLMGDRYRPFPIA